VQNYFFFFYSSRFLTRFNTRQNKPYLETRRNVWNVPKSFEFVNTINKIEDSQDQVAFLHSLACSSDVSDMSRLIMRMKSRTDPSKCRCKKIKLFSTTFRDRSLIYYRKNEKIWLSCGKPQGSVVQHLGYWLNDREIVFLLPD
jgi:hypothetical protein